MRLKFRSMGVLLAATFACGASAQSYPSKPIRVIVGQAPGGATDIVSRALAQKLTDGLGQTVVIDNRSGAAGSIGSAIAASAPPDGYTALIVSSTYTINPSLYKKLPFDPVRDLQPVTLIASSPFLLMVHPSIAAKTPRELIALAKTRKLTFASGGIGSSGHLAAELFSSMAGIELTHVPYKGAGPALIDTLGGQVNLIMSSIVSGMPYAKAGRLRALAITTRTRSPALPELPTISESALPGYDFSSWYGLMVPAGTPQPVIGRLHDETVKALKLPDLQQRLASEGCDAVGSTPEQLAAYIKTEMARWAKVVKASGMQAE
ncbi:MAG TPA: tripartite tricarboxylate transporter substrate binding protein [Burkholderiales bacterium]|nr:tripartite tricarboxylate transporter substrate binding protein [Burkholderiales bacterium]